MDKEQVVVTHVAPPPSVPPHEHHLKKYPFRYFSWTAAFVGALVGLGLAFLAHLLILGVGLVTFNPDQHTIFLLTMVGLALAAVFTYLTMFIGGWVAGRLARNCCFAHHHTCGRGMLHGFTAWCLALIIGFMLIPHMHKLPLRPYVMQQTVSQPAVNTTTQVVVKTDNTAVNVVEMKHNLGKITLVVFGLSLLGALAGAVGGSCGIKHKSKDEECLIEEKHV